MHITCASHRIVISNEHLAVAGADFFVFLASFAVSSKREFYTVKLKTDYCIYKFSTHKVIAFSKSQPWVYS